MLNVLWLMKRLCMGVLWFVLCFEICVSWWNVSVKFVWFVCIVLSSLFVSLVLFLCLSVRLSFVCIVCLSVGLKCFGNFVSMVWVLFIVCLVCVLLLVMLCCSLISGSSVCVR